MAELRLGMTLRVNGEGRAVGDRVPLRAWSKEKEEEGRVVGYVRITFIKDGRAMGKVEELVKDEQG